MNRRWHCPTFEIEVAQRSDLGMRRMNNQDSLAVVTTDDEAKWTTRGHLLMVADGMGAHAAGELASKMAVDNIPHTYFKLRDLYPPAALRQAIREVNSLIYSKGQSSIGFQGMGTTCSCLVLLPQGALVAHVGDSRVYRLRGKQLAQLTFDHSLVWEMAAAGRMAQEDVPSYIPKNVITRSLGPHENVNIDLEGPFDAAPGDVFLLCSDGLSGQLSDAEIGAILHVLPPEEAVQTLVDLANLRGGPDNITVIAAKIGGRDGGCAKPRNSDLLDTAVGAPTATTAESMALPVVAVAALLAAAFCLVNSWWLPAGVAGGVMAVAAALIVARQRGGGGRCPEPVPLGGPYGNGPHRTITAEPDEKLVESLASLAEKLHTVPEGHVPRLDWQPIEGALTEARRAAAARDYTTAVRRYAEALRGVMGQLRTHKAVVGEESGVDRR